MTNTPEANHQPDPHLQAAIEEEQQLLDRAVLAAQAQHLMNRAVELNTQLRRANAAAAAGAQRQAEAPDVEEPAEPLPPA